MTSLTEQSTSTKMRILLCGLLLLFIALPVSLAAFGSNKDRVLLSDIHSLTLYNGRMTNGRRSSPVPQLKCVGGSAAGAFVPQVVQCTNKGSDGYDAQWECKTDMDNAFRFGNVEVTCEGYDYPDDPYVLRGSCGLEYTLDYTKEGYQQQHHSGHHDYYGNQDYQQHHNTYNTYKNSYARKAGSVMGDLVFLGVVAIIIYVIYKTCIASNRHATSDNHDNSNRFGNERRPPPPPYGFKDDYTQGTLFHRHTLVQTLEHIQAVPVMQAEDSGQVHSLAGYLVTCLVTATTMDPKHITHHGGEDGVEDGTGDGAAMDGEAGAVDGEALVGHTQHQIIHLAQVASVPDPPVLALALHQDLVEQREGDLFKSTLSHRCLFYFPLM